MNGRPNASRAPLGRGTGLRLLLLVIFCCSASSIPTPAHACVWDRDTLFAERMRFPDTLELIAGKFVRHSVPFYQWRVEDRRKRLKDAPSDLSLYDDLAVALDKVGDSAGAIAVMVKASALSADRYETMANLGTFHIHAGNLREGLKFIGRAIDINPDAHFGREVYQKRLVEYVLSRQIDGQSVLPLRFRRDGQRSTSPSRDSFATFVLSFVAQDEDKNAELERAIKGVLGMMHFGNYDSPVLLEALGDLLRHGRSKRNAARMAARAYLKASYQVKDATSRSHYRALARTAVDGYEETVTNFELIEASLKDELAQADAWFANGIAADEQRWIAESSDVEALFDETYRGKKAWLRSVSRVPEAAAPVKSEPSSAAKTADADATPIVTIVLACLVVMGCGVWLLWRRSRKTASRNERPPTEA